MGYTLKHGLVQAVRGLSWRSRALVVAGTVIVAGGGATAALAASGDVPVASGQLQGQVNVCVDKSNESVQYVELHSQKAGNCAPGYVQYKTNVPGPAGPQGPAGPAGAGSGSDDDSAYVKTSDLPAEIKANDDDSAVGGLASTFTLNAGGMSETCSLSQDSTSGQLAGIVCAEITSANTLSASKSATSASSLTVHTANFAAGSKVALTESGALPSGVTFTDNGDGTATLTAAGPLPAADATGSYPVTLTATAGSQKATQDFTLVVTP